MGINDIASSYLIGVQTHAAGLMPRLDTLIRIKCNGSGAETHLHSLLSAYHQADSPAERHVHECVGGGLGNRHALHHARPCCCASCCHQYQGAAACMRLLLTGHRVGEVGGCHPTPTWRRMPWLLSAPWCSARTSGSGASWWQWMFWLRREGSGEWDRPPVKVQVYLRWPEPSRA
jgi:hypothetical protein